MGTVVAAELSRIFTFQLWHVGATAGLILIMVILTVRRRLRKTFDHDLLHPQHIQEVAEALDLVSSLAAAKIEISRENDISAGIPLARTYLGIQISASKIKHGTGYLNHYALSSQNGTLTQDTAKLLVRLIVQLRHSSNSNEVIQGNQGIYHLLIHP